jgi:uncharacterized protein (DUF2235 family)
VYSFICNNYASPDDEIYLVGFSRGAFTVRSIAQLINDVGLLTKYGLLHLHKIFELWKRKLKPSKRRGQLCPREALLRQCEDLTSTGALLRDIKIRVCAVWDTVSSLGVPMIGVLPQPSPRKLKFVNSELCPNIENAFQALSLYEHRRHFQAIVWRKTKESQQNLKQAWFLGYHSDVGGGNKDAALAHIALVWMMAQMNESRGFLSFSSSNLWQSKVPNTITEEVLWTLQSKTIGIVNLGYAVSWSKKLSGLNRTHPSPSVIEVY